MQSVEGKSQLTPYEECTSFQRKEEGRRMGRQLDRGHSGSHVRAREERLGVGPEDKGGRKEEEKFIKRREGQKEEKEEKEEKGQRREGSRRQRKEDQEGEQQLSREEGSTRRFDQRQEVSRGSFREHRIRSRPSSKKEIRQENKESPQEGEVHIIHERFREQHLGLISGRQFRSHGGQVEDSEDLEEIPGSFGCNGHWNYEGVHQPDWWHGVGQRGGSAAAHSWSIQPPLSGSKDFGGNPARNSLPLPYWGPNTPRSDFRGDGCATAASQEPGDGGKRRKLADKPEARAYNASRDKHQHKERAADCDQRGKVRPDSQADSGRQRYRQRKDKRQRKRQGSKREEQEQRGRQEAVREEEREKKDVLPRRGRKQDYEAGGDQPKGRSLTSKSITAKPPECQSLPREGWTTEEKQYRESQKEVRRHVPQKLRRLPKKSVNFLGGDRKKQGVSLARWRKRLKDLKMKLRTGTSSTDALGPTSESVTAAATDCHRVFSKPPDFEGEVSNVDSLGMGQALESKTVLSSSCCVGETLGDIFMWLDKAADDLFVSSCKTVSTGRAFPLPSSPAVLAKLFPNSSLAVRCTLRVLIRSLNSLNGEGEGSEIMATEYQIAILKGLVEDCERVQGWKFETVPPSWEEFFRVRGIDYKGEEILTAQSMQWENVAPALPTEVGSVRLEDVCELGCKHYVLNFEEYLIDPADQVYGRPPKVMVDPNNWSTFCAELLARGIFSRIHESEVYKVGGRPLVNGLFGGSKK